MMSTPASTEHQQAFRKNFSLCHEVKHDPYWQMAFEHAATHKLSLKETIVIGQVLVRNTTDEPTRYSLP